MEKKALGKGLSALIPEKVVLDAQDIKSEGVMVVPVSSIRENSLQPRTKYDEIKIAELQSSIKEKGMLQPILVREVENGYEVIAGERRLRAARANNMEEIPVVVKNVSNQEALVLALVENIQREELNAIEEAAAFNRLIDEFHMSQDEIAFSVGKDRSTISNILRLLKLPQEIQNSVVDGQLNMGHARALLSIEDPAKQKFVFSQAVQRGLSVREVENLARHNLDSAGLQRRHKPKAKSHELVFIEEDLQQYLGTKVRIEAQKKRGKIIVEYYSPDDLERILTLIRK